MGTGDLCWEPPAAVHHERARQSAGMRPCGYCTGVLRVQDDGGRHVVKGSSDPRVAHPEVKVQIWNLVRVEDIFAPFAPRGFSIRGKFVLSSPSVYMGTGDLCWVLQAAVHHGRARQSSGTGSCGYCRGLL